MSYVYSGIYGTWDSVPEGQSPIPVIWIGKLSHNEGVLRGMNASDAVGRSIVNHKPRSYVLLELRLSAEQIAPEGKRCGPVYVRLWGSKSSCESYLLPVRLVHSLTGHRCGRSLVLNWLLDAVVCLLLCLRHNDHWSGGMYLPYGSNSVDDLVDEYVPTAPIVFFYFPIVCMRNLELA